MWGELARNLADSIIIPFNVSDYTATLSAQLTSLQTEYGALMVKNGLADGLGNGISVIYWGTTVWNIDINFVVLKKKQIKKSKNLCLVKFEVLGYKNTQKCMIAYHVHIRSTDEFKQVGMSEKK